MPHWISTSRPALWVGCFIVAAALQGCGGGGSCAVDGDCFQGEVCSAGHCELAANNGTPNGAPNNVAANAATNSGNNGTVRNNSTAGTNGQTSASACLVDLVGNSCAEDEWEENDGYDAATPRWDQTPWQSDSWCVGDTLPEPERTLSGTLCAGDRGDAFRLVVANNGPMCLTADFTTFRILVQLKTECDPSLIRVEPYTFGRDPIRNDLCADDELVRCTVSNGGMTHLIEWAWPQSQIFDPRVQIMAEAQNVQVDYDLTFTIGQ